MTHLSPSEFVDFADGTLAPARAAHADGCDHCRAQCALVGDAIRRTAAAEIPEPSPLFWEHLSSRVREAIAAEQPESPWSWLGGREWMRLSAAMAIVVAVVSTVWLVRDSGTSHAPRPTAVEQAVPVPPASQTGIDVDGSVDPHDADVWAVLTAAASDMAIEEARAAGMKAHPAAVDRAVQGLTTAELNELGRLLQSELKRSGN